MKKRRFPVFRLFLAVLVVALAAGSVMTWERAVRDPVEVRTLKKQEVESTDQGHQEYYFNLLDDDEKRGYREILRGSGPMRRISTCLWAEMTRSTEFITQC